MMIWTTRLSKRKAAFAAAALAVAIAAVCFLSGRPEPSPAGTDTILSTNEDRVAYLQSLGWEVEPEPVETLQFLLPEELDGTYAAYNQQQLPQGYDLSRACGKQVVRYTYTVTNYPDRAEGVQANLYVCEEVPVAGDILCPGSDGFQAALIQTDAGDGA